MESCDCPAASQESYHDFDMHHCCISRLCVLEVARTRFTAAHGAPQLLGRLTIACCAVDQCPTSELRLGDLLF